MNDRREQERIALEIAGRGSGVDPFVAAVRATRMPMLITNPRRPDNPIVFVNDAFSRLTGFAREEILGRNCRFLQGPETDGRDVDRIRDAIARRVPIELDLLNHRKDGTVFWNRLLISPVFGEDGELIYFFASQFDVTMERDRLVRLQRDRDDLELEVKRRKADLTHSEDRLRFALRAGRLGTWSLDLATNRLMASATCKEIFGRNPDEPFTLEDLRAAVAPEDRERVRAAAEAAVRTRADYDVEYRVATPSGAERWVQVRGQPSYRADGTPLGLDGVSFDVTDRKRAEEHRLLLANELRHRVKNTLATVQAIVHQTLRTAGTVADARAALDARIRSLSAVHDMLTRENWHGATLSGIVAEALRPFQSGGDRFRIDGPRVGLPPRIALAFAMALHELATNAVKYGALSNETGHVVLGWQVVNGSGPERLRLCWEEVGGPPVAPPARTGFGSRMIERALALELGGRAEIDYRPNGIVFTAEAPLPDPHADDGGRDPMSVGPGAEP